MFGDQKFVDCFATPIPEIPSLVLLCVQGVSAWDIVGYWMVLDCNMLSWFRSILPISHHKSKMNQYAMKIHDKSASYSQL